MIPLLGAAAGWVASKIAPKAPAAPAPAAPAVNSLIPGVNIGGGVGMTFGNPMGIPTWALIAGALVLAFLLLRKR